MPLDELTADRLDALLERARGVRVLVVGDLMLDRYLRGPASRISPEAPVPVVRVRDEWRALGGAANVAANVRKLGARCEPVGCAGRDPAGERLRKMLAELGTDGRGLCADGGRPTTVKTRIMARHQQIARYDREDDTDIGEQCASALVAGIDALAAECDAIVLEDYNKGVLTPPVIEAALDAGRRHDLPVVVDPKLRRFFDYADATVFKPNRVELEAALQESVHADDAEWMERTRRHLDCGHLLVTLGADGMALMSADGEHVCVPTAARSVYDVSGAGDTAVAALAVALAAGASVPEAAVFANRAAGIEVGKAGVATVSPDEMRDAVPGQER